MAKYFLLLIGLLVGLGAAVAYSALKPPPGRRRPRPNRKRHDKLIQTITPIAAAILLSIMAWVGLSFLFSSDRTDEETAQNTVTSEVPAAVHNRITHKVTVGDLDNTTAAPRPETVKKPVETAKKREPANEPVSKQEPVPARASDPGPMTRVGRSLLASKSSLPEAAQWASPMDSHPMNSPMEEAGLGRKLNQAEPEPAADGPLVQIAETPAIRPKTLPRPKREPSLTDIYPELKPQPKRIPAHQDVSRAGESMYTVLLASFSIEGNAARNLARLRAAGVPVFISSTQVDNRPFFRLMAGRFNTRAQALEYGRRLERNGLTSETGRYMIKSLYNGSAF